QALTEYRDLQNAVSTAGSRRAGPLQRLDSHQRRFVRPAVRQDVHRAIGHPVLVLELLLERLQSLAKRLPREKPLGLLTPIWTDDDGHVLLGLVVVARFQAERHLTALIEPHHEGLLGCLGPAAGAWFQPDLLPRSTSFKF